MRSKLNGFASPVRDTVMFTVVPAAPRNRMIASVTLSSLTVTPSMLTMTSPLRMPALSAGVPSMGATTRTLPSRRLTSRPTPE